MASYVRRFIQDPGDDVLLEIESINILDLDPPAAIQGLGTGTVNLFGEFEDGPYNTPTEVTSPDDLRTTFGTLGYTYQGVVANYPSALARKADSAVVNEYWNGNAMVQLNGKKFARLVLTRVDTSTGETTFTRLASVSGLSKFTYDLEPGQLISLDLGSGPTPAIFSATAAIVTGVAATYAFVDGDTLNLAYDGQPGAPIAVNVVFLATDNSVAAAVARINSYAGFALASNSAGQIRLTSRRRGNQGLVQVVGGTAVGAKSGLSVATTLGTGNVGDIDAVTHTEVKTVIEAAVSGTVVDFLSDGTPRVSNTSGGGTGSILVGFNSAVDLGFTTDQVASQPNGYAMLTSATGTYPTTFAGGETLTLGFDTDPNVVVTFTVGDQTRAQVISRINAAAGFTAAAVHPTDALRIILTGRVNGGQIRVLAASVALVSTATGFGAPYFTARTVTATTLTNSSIPAGTRILSATTGKRFVTTQTKAVTVGTATYTARVRFAKDDGTETAGELAGALTRLEFPVDGSGYTVVNLLGVAACLTESALDVAYTTAFDKTLNINSVAKEINITWSARQSNVVRRALKQNALDASANGLQGRITCVRPPLGTTRANAESNLAEPGVGPYRSDRLVYNFPGVQTNVPAIAQRGTSGGAGFTSTGNVDVGSDGFCASVMSQLAPEENPGQDTTFANAAIAIESAYANQVLDINDYKAFKRQGICAPRFDAGEMTFQSGVTSVDPTLQPNRVNIARRRMADFIQDSIAARGKAYGKKLNNVKNRLALLGEIRAFLIGLLSPDNTASQRINEFSTSIGSDAGNTAVRLGRGMFRVLIKVRTLSSLDSIVLATVIGEQVVVTEEAA